MFAHSEFFTLLLYTPPTHKSKEEYCSYAFFYVSRKWQTQVDHSFWNSRILQQLTDIQDVGFPNFLQFALRFNSWVLVSNSNVSDEEHFPNRRWFLKKLAMDLITPLTVVRLGILNLSRQLKETTIVVSSKPKHRKNTFSLMKLTLEGVLSALHAETENVGPWASFAKNSFVWNTRRKWCVPTVEFFKYMFWWYDHVY